MPKARRSAVQPCTTNSDLLRISGLFAEFRGEAFCFQKADRPHPSEKSQAIPIRKSAPYSHGGGPTYAGNACRKGGFGDTRLAGYWCRNRKEAGKSGSKLHHRSPSVSGWRIQRLILPEDAADSPPFSHASRAHHARRFNIRALASSKRRAIFSPSEGCSCSVSGSHSLRVTLKKSPP